MKKSSLQVIKNGRVVFESDKEWLHPLFDLEDYLRAKSITIHGAEVHDKVIGKAAALMIIRLEPGSVYGEVMSELGQSALEKAGIPYSYSKLVDHIDCLTEELLMNEDDPDRAYKLLRQRAGRL